MGQEFRRDKVIQDIKSKLEKEWKLLIVGESEISKSTLLMEIMCDYFDIGFKVLYNYGQDGIKNAGGLVNLLERMVTEGNKVLVAVDNVHNKRTSPIFYVIDKLSSFKLAHNLRFIITARLPDFDRLVKDRLEKVDEAVRRSIRKMLQDPNFRYRLGQFTREETTQMIGQYSGKTSKNESDKRSQMIYDYTKGDPIMIKFHMFGQGLDQDVREKHDRYLKPQSKLKAMIICSLFDLANLKITNTILEKCNILKSVYDLEGATLRQNPEGIWNTKHVRWDAELLSMLYNEQNNAILFNTTQYLQNAIYSIFDIGDETITESIIEILYNLCIEGIIPIGIVDKVIKIPEYLSKDSKCILHGLAYNRRKN